MTTKLDPLPPPKLRINPLVANVYKTSCRMSADHRTSWCGHCGLEGHKQGPGELSATLHSPGCELARLYQQEGGVVEFLPRPPRQLQNELTPEEACQKYGPDTLRMSFPQELALTVIGGNVIRWDSGIHDVPAVLADNEFLKKAGVEVVG